MSSQPSHFSKQESLGGLAARAFLYMILFIAIGYVPLLDVAFNPWGLETVFTDYSFLEMTQTLFLLIGLGTIAALAFRGLLPQLNILMAALLTAALVRESDGFLDLIYDGLWQIIVALLLAGIVYFLAKNKTALREQVVWLGRHFSLGLMMAGFVTITGFSRSYGSGDMWKNAMGDRFYREIQDFAQESMELLGYLILLIGLIEFSVAVRRQFQPQS